MAGAEGRDADLWAHAVHGVVVMLFSMGRLDEALATAEDALRRLPALVTPGLRGDLHQVLARILCLRGDLARSRSSNEKSLRLALPPHDLDGRGQALLTRGRLALIRLEPSAAREAFQAALDYAMEQKSASYQSVAWAGLASAHLAVGDLAAASVALGQAQALHARVGERTLELQLASAEGDLELLRSDGDAAERHYRRVLGLCRDAEIPGVRVHALLGLARLELKRARAGRARDRAREAAAATAHGDLGGLAPAVRLIEAETLAAAGANREALRALRQAASCFAAWRSGPGETRCALLEVRVRGRRTPRGLGARAAALAVRHRDDVIGWMREESRWVAPLLTPHLAGNGVDALLVDLGRDAVDALIAALEIPRTRLHAIAALEKLGDPRARRPLQRWSRDGDPASRSAATRALVTVAPPGPPTVDIRMLGGFEVRRDGKPVGASEWTTRKARALVKLLVLHRPVGLHDEQLLEWLWPDRDAARGMSNLKTAVKLARRALEPWMEGAGSHFLRREGRVLRLDGTHARVDLDEHQRLVAEGRAHAAAGRVDLAIAAFERATGLYHGDLLDPEDRYEAWTEGPRESWRRAQADALAHLSRLLASRADYEGAAIAMRGVVALDPVRESAYRDLMQYALRRGRRDEAMATYRECVQALEEGLGVMPALATRRLLEEVRHLA